MANVAANLWLVPTQGINGAAIATVLTEVVVTAGCTITLVRHERSARRFIAKVHYEGSL
jgi:Na+-driven multidrug efflux pump